jgi:hypothetical protein
MSLFGIVYGIVEKDWRIAVPTSIFFCTYPIINEAVYNACASLSSQKYKYNINIKINNPNRQNKDKEGKETLSNNNMNS